MKLTNFVLLFAAILLSGIVTLGYAGIEPRIDGPTVSPDGSQVAFVIMQESPQLCILDLESKKVQKIHTPGCILEAFYGLSWDPIAAKFVIITIVEGTRQNLGSWSIWKISVPEGKSDKIAEIRNEICQRGLISPDGKSVLFRVAGRKDLVSVNLESKKCQFLTKSGDVYRLGYSWGTDSRIYFSRGYMAETGGIWVMNVDGSSRLISDKFQGYNLGISSTGQYIAFTVSGGKKENYKDTLFVSSLRKFNPVKISQDSGHFFNWAPNNDVLAYESVNDIKVWRPSSKESSKGDMQKIGNGKYPVWREKGKVILFIRNKIELWKYDVSSGGAERIFSIKE